MYEIVPSTAAIVWAQLSGSLERENQSHEIQGSALHSEKADSSSSVTQEGLVCPTETKTLLH